MQKAALCALATIFVSASIVEAQYGPRGPSVPSPGGYGGGYGNRSAGGVNRPTPGVRYDPRPVVPDPRPKIPDPRPYVPNTRPHVPTPYQPSSYPNGYGPNSPSYSYSPSYSPSYYTASSPRQSNGPAGFTSQFPWIPRESLILSLVMQGLMLVTATGFVVYKYFIAPDKRPAAAGPPPLPTRRSTYGPEAMYDIPLNDGQS